MKFNYNELKVGEFLCLGLDDNNSDGNITGAQEYLLKNKYILLENDKHRAIFWLSKKVSYLSSDYILVGYNYKSQKPAIFLNYEY